MNNKVKIITATLAVGMAAIMTGCGGCFGCAGCSGKSSSNTLTRSNWFSGTSYNGIQPSFIEGNDNFSKEVITYDVSYDGSKAGNDYVSVDYKDGVFTTEFYAREYDWANSSIPEGYAPEKAGKEIVYYYKTELSISVKYTLKVGNKASSDWFDDHVVTESWFRAAGKNLQPVYSRQTVKSTSPASYQPKTLQQAYKEVDVSYENFYNHSCTSVLSKATENGSTESKEFTKLNKLDNTLFDNSSLYVVVRSMKLSKDLSESISLFSAAAGGTDKYAVAGTDTPLTAEERASYTSALNAKGLYKAGEKDEGVEYTAVTVSYAGGDLHGTSQTIWYASITDNDYNVSRATMLKLSVPISFSLGTLNYSLKEVGSTLWNE